MDGTGEPAYGTISIAVVQATACVDAGGGNYRRPSALDHVTFSFVRNGEGVDQIVWPVSVLDDLCELGLQPTEDTVNLLPGNAWVIEGSLRDNAGTRLNLSTLATYPATGSIVQDVPVFWGETTEVVLTFVPAAGALNVDASWDGDDYDF